MAIYYFNLALLPLALLAVLVLRREVELVTLFIIGVAAISISALRWASDIDHMEYAQMFEENPDLPAFNADSIATLHGEPGYLFISAIIKSLGFGFVTLSSICALFAIGAKVLVAKGLSRSSSLVVALYLCIHFVTIEFIQIRWAVATALIMIAIYLQARRHLAAAFAVLLVSTSIHYFAAIFFLVCLLAEVRNEKTFYAVVFLVALAGVGLAADGFHFPLVGDSELYVVKRALRYLTDPLSDVGVLSYAKIAIFPVLFCILEKKYPHVKNDKVVRFLKRVAFASIAATMLVSFIPLMHFRAVVVADFLSLLLVFRMLDHRVRVEDRAAIALVFCALYGTWFVVDIDNYVAADRLYPYQTWIQRD